MEEKTRDITLDLTWKGILVTVRLEEYCLPTPNWLVTGVYHLVGQIMGSEDICRASVEELSRRIGPCKYLVFDPHPSLSGLFWHGDGGRLMSRGPYSLLGTAGTIPSDPEIVERCKRAYTYLQHHSLDESYLSFSLPSDPHPVLADEEAVTQAPITVATLPIELATKYASGKSLRRPQPSLLWNESAEDTEFRVGRSVVEPLFTLHGDLSLEDLKKIREAVNTAIYDKERAK